jgi:iron complex outermembrane receptor protein
MRRQVKSRHIFQNILMGCASATAVTAVLATPAYAQETSSEGNAEIVVTAQFREQNLQDTPIAITAQTGEMLAERGITTTKQLVAVAPNVNLTSNASVFGVSTSVFIRGIGQYDNNFAYEPGVGIYLDDIYYGVITGADFALADIDRVEILRGPQGTLAGKNSEGGSIRLYNRKPRGDGSGYVEATYGQFNRIDVKGAFDLALSPDQLALRVSGFSNSRDGYLKRLDYACAHPADAGNIPTLGTGGDCVIGREGGVRNWGVRAALRYTPSSDIEVNIAADRTVDNSDPAALSLFYAFAPFGAPTYDGAVGGTPWDYHFVPDDPYTSYATYKNTVSGFEPGATTYTKAWGVSGDISWNIGDGFSLRSITGYRDLETRAGFDQDGSPIGLAQTLIYNTYHQFTQELRLSGETDLLDWTVGGFYYDATGVLQNTIDSGPTQFKTDDPVDTTSKSAFGHIVLHPAQNFNITAGIRYTDDKKTYDFTRYDLQGGPANPAQEPLNALPLQVYSGDHVDYRIGVDYRFSPELMAYAQFSTGYKGGGVNAKPFTAGQAIPFNPETLDAWEIGIKTDLADNRVRLNFAGFYSKYHDIVLVNASGYCVPPETPLNSTCFLSALPFNAGSADIKGVEFEADLEPIEGLSISGSLSYLDFKYTELDPAAIASSISLNDYPPLTPKWKASGGIAYAFDLGNGAKITPRADVSYQSETYSDPANNGFYPAGFPTDDVHFGGLNPYLIPEHTTVNARITFDSPDKTWQASVSVSNLTNEYYWTNNFAFYFSGTGQHVLAPPREWAVTVKRNF